MNFIDIIKSEITKVVATNYKLNLEPNNIHVERPGKEMWGDYSTNVSLTIAKVLKQDPMKIAKSVCYEILENEAKFELEGIEHKIFEKVEFEAPGFINFTFSNLFLLSQDNIEIENLKNQAKINATGLLRGQNVLLEYTDPNPFKVFHIGHLMSNAIGESLSRIIEHQGAFVKRANYQGDVGMHIAKSVWGLFRKFEHESLTLSDIEKWDLEKRMQFLGASYSLGATEFELDIKAKEEMKQINSLVYMAAQERLQNEESWSPLINYSPSTAGTSKYTLEEIREIYIKGRKWSLEEFEVLYKKLGTHFDFYFFESLVGEFGYKIVMEGLEKGIFEKSDGAIIFNGEKYGLHTRVFINSLGFPVYESKDLGLAFLKYEKYKYDKSYIITANEIDQYFKVVLKAMEQINKTLAEKTIHIGHGMMKFKEGKMSSRKGDVVTGKTMLEDAKQAILTQMLISNTTLSLEDATLIAEKLSVAAVKYSILKHNSQKDIVYDQETAISVTGNTGPYLEYTHARTMSIINKVAEKPLYDLLHLSIDYLGSTNLEPQELVLLKHLLHFEETVVRSYEELSPSILCEYLFELAQKFNSFYNDLSILNADDEGSKSLRLYITRQVQKKLNRGLWLLGIEALDRV